MFENVEVLDAGSEGKAIARVDEMVIFVPYVAPGDIIDIQVVRKRKSYYEGKAVNIHKYSAKRESPFCEHFGTCGGCKWQHLKYEAQLLFKQKLVEDNLRRIGKIELPEINAILPSEKQKYYRNKLEYTFSNRGWLTDINSLGENPSARNALGFHIPGMFDRVINIDHCYLQEEPSNRIRIAVRNYALKHELEFYDVKKWTGFLRNLLIRTTSTGEVMVIVVFRFDDQPVIQGLLDFIDKQFPEIDSLMYVINEKKNDVISDLDILLFKGRDHIIENMPSYNREEKDLKFKIGPVSFFQTNSYQAVKLYQTALDYADLKGDEIVYDLYTGTGTIANYIASMAKKVVGIEYIPAAIEDALENSKFNNISNSSFFAGDIVKVLDDQFVEENGKPDVIITDPPRAGMHEKVVQQILKISPQKVVYISCNPATQARDLSLMDMDYRVIKVQPVDMFPHTQHVENVVLLHHR